jgi:hypothetical protein
MSAIALFLITNMLVFAIKLPHLMKKKEGDAEGEGEPRGEDGSRQ